MKRVEHIPRVAGEAWFGDVGCASLMGDHAWRSDVYYQFTPQQMATLKTAAVEMEALCLKTVEHVISNRLYDAMGMPESSVLRTEIETSWERQEPGLRGRMDIAYDGHSAPKLLEYNGEDQGLMLESALLQAAWHAREKPESDQLNSMEQQLVAAWRATRISRIVFLMLDEGGEGATVEKDSRQLLKRTAEQAGIEVMLMSESVMQTDHEYLRTPDGAKIDHLLLAEDRYAMLEHGYFSCFNPARIRLIEPAWRTLLSHKAVLAQMWDLFPDHPNLLRTSFDASRMEGAYVSKPALGWGGQNITLHSADKPQHSEGRLGAHPMIHQQHAPLACHDGYYSVAGVWMIHGEPAGLSIREDTTPIIQTRSISVPHIIEEDV